jgi:voltage-gated potassium channel
MAGVSVRGAMIAIVVVAVLVSLIGAFAVYLIDDEAFPTFGRAAWWAVVTVSTVGYGDVVPDTDQGRVVASGLILFSMAFFPLLTGLVTAALIARAQRFAQDEEEQGADERQRQLLDVLHSLDERIARLEREGGPPGG